MFFDNYRMATSEWWDISVRHYRNQSRNTAYSEGNCLLSLGWRWNTSTNNCMVESSWYETTIKFWNGFWTSGSWKNKRLDESKGWENTSLTLNTTVATAIIMLTPCQKDLALKFASTVWIRRFKTSGENTETLRVTDIVHDDWQATEIFMEQRKDSELHFLTEWNKSGASM